MKKAGFLCIFAAVLLSSCVGVDSRLTVHQDGSGTLALTYRVSQLVANLGNPLDGNGVIPLPLAKTDFERSVASSQGMVRMTAFDRSEDQKDVTIRVELAFDSLDALAKLDAFQSAQIRFSSDGASHSFSQVIAKAPREPITQDSLRMVDAFFGDYDLAFAIEAPQPIKTNTLGTLSDDKRVLTYKTSVKDLVRTKSDVILSMSW